MLQASLDRQILSTFYLIYGLGKYDHIQHVLRDRLHWLPMSQRVKLKLCLLTFKAIHGLAPRYIADLCRPVTGSRRPATRAILWCQHTSPTSVNGRLQWPHPKSGTSFQPASETVRQWAPSKPDWRLICSRHKLLIVHFVLYWLTTLSQRGPRWPCTVAPL